MNINEAIDHAIEKGAGLWDRDELDCACEHLELADWLTRYRDLGTVKEILNDALRNYKFKKCEEMGQQAKHKDEERVKETLSEIIKINKAIGFVGCLDKFEEEK